MPTSNGFVSYHMSQPNARMPPSMRRMWQGPITSSPCGRPASSTVFHSLVPFFVASCR